MPVRPAQSLVADGASNNADTEALYRSQGPRLLRFFLRSRSYGDDGFDLVQELFLRFSGLNGRNIHRVERPEAYLHQMARNLLRDRAKLSHRRAYDLHLPLDDAVLAGPALEPQLEARDMLGRVEAAMLQLKPRTREVFMACRVDGLSYAEISEQTGLSFKIIEKEMARALAHLHQIFSED